MRNKWLIIFSLLAWLIPGVSAASDPVVSNIAMIQRSDDSGLVDIFYDVSDAENDTLAVALNISDDGGSTWHFPCSSVSGDVGQGVLPGTGKVIVWDLAFDSPDNSGQNIQARVVASDAGVEHTTHSPGNYWITEYGWVDWTDQNMVEKVAKSDVYLFNSWYLWGHELNEELRVIERLKAINPDLIVLAYVQAKTSNLSWEANSNYPYTQALFERTRPYWSYTTEGDTLMDWPGQIVLDMLNPDCRDAIAETLAEFAQGSNNLVDGVFWDYFNNKIWVSYSVRDQVNGDADMDGDGIPMAQDEDEMAAYQAGCDSLVIRTRELMGDDFIQVFNGQRAMADSSFAALGDGIYYEIYPTELFPDPDTATSLDPTYENNLFRTMNWPRTANGGPFNVLGNQWKNIYFDQNNNAQHFNLGNIHRAIGLLTGNYSNWLGGDGHEYDWTNVEFNLGQPIASVVISGDHYFREYQHGTIDLYMKSGAYPDPFRYEIKVNGVVVESFDRPYRYP